MQREEAEPLVKALVEALCAGSVLLSARGADRAFQLEALGLADSRSFSHVVAEPNILYGTNLAIDRVLFLSEMKVSPDTLKQLTGRVGRTGKGATAEVVLMSMEPCFRAVETLGSLEPCALDSMFESL